MPLHFSGPAGSIPRRGRIYPLRVKPHSRINRWGDWPEELEDTIRQMVRGWYPTGGVFKCTDCEQFCQPHPYGVAHIGDRGEQAKAILCDDCVIARARSVVNAP